MHRRILTRDTLAKNVHLCGSKPESVNHLFFEREFPNECLKGVFEWLKIGVKRIVKTNDKKSQRKDKYIDH